MNVQSVSIEVGGRPMTIETGKLAKQANGSVVIRQDDSMVLVTACATKDDVPFDFLPLDCCLSRPYSSIWLYPRRF